MSSLVRCDVIHTGLSGVSGEVIVCLCLCVCVCVCPCVSQLEELRESESALRVRVKDLASELASLRRG